MPRVLRTLLLEDSQADARLVLHALRQSGFDVQSERVESESDYLAHLGSGWDVILSDYNMPQFDALQALQLLREREPEIPFIIVSGTIGEDIAVQAMQQGAADYLLKDRLGRLGQAVTHALEQKRLRAEARQADQERRAAADAIAKQNERLRILHQIDRALIAAEGPEAIAAAALPALRELLGVPRAIVNLIDLATGEVEWLAGAGRHRVHIGPGVRYSIRLMGDVEALRRGEPQFLDVASLPPGPEVDALLASGVRTYVVVPMIAEGKLIGGLSFGGESGPFSAEQISIAEEVGTQFAIALLQARLQERVKRQAQELRNAFELLRTLIDALPDVVFTKDLAGRFVVCNPAGVHLVGRTREDEVASKTVFDLYPRELAEQYHADDLQVLAGTPVLNREEPCVDATGNRLCHLTIKVPLRDQAGTVIGLVGISRNITDRKILEEQYRQAQKMEAVGKLAGGVAHDFNNLLTVIMGYSEIYLSSLRPEDPLRVPLAEIRKAGERATGLTRQLLAFSRKQVLQPVVLDLNGILAEMEKMLRRLIGEDIALNVLFGKDLWHVKADPGQMEQVLMNIVVNARDAMPLGGKLLLETNNIELDEDYTQAHTYAQPGDYVLLAISDTGHGMDAATKARIFEPFFTTKGPTKGTGLGLATVYGIVKQSGGCIEVYSEVGHGTTFKIYLPRDRSGNATASVSRKTQAVRGGSETILLVEDEEGIRTLAKTVLQRYGYTVIEAKNGGEALLFCENYTKPIALLVTDVVMPNLSGRQLAERLATRQPNMKVLYMSGYTDDAIVHHGILESGIPFLQKPFATDALARIVREVLDQ